MTQTTFTVYRATNSINGKTFVGVASDWPSERLSHEAARGDTEPFHRALRKYGPPLFRWEALLQTSDAKKANKLAIELFQNSRAPEQGYNNEVTLAPVKDNEIHRSAKAVEPVPEKVQVHIPKTGTIIPKTGIKGKITEEGRRKISEAVSRPVTIEGIKYRSIAEATNKLNLPRHQVKMIIKGKNSVAYYKAKNAEAGK